VNLDFEKFEKLIGFTHPKKARYLNAAIQRRYRKQRTRSIKELENAIITHLKSNKVRTISIANKIKLTIGHTLVHLKRMEKEGKLKSEKEEGKYFIWGRPTVSSKQ